MEQLELPMDIDWDARCKKLQDAKPIDWQALYRAYFERDKARGDLAPCGYMPGKCCSKAMRDISTRCVCMGITVCPEHGTRHNGTHD